MAVAEALPDDGFRGVDERRKRLGQYFSGVELARLLAAVAGIRDAGSVIDPMVGSGDMLIGSLAQGTPSLLGGIELDPVAYAQGAARLERIDVDTSALTLGSAFCPSVVAQLPTRAWDAVITNPPYVRYQSTSRIAGTGMRIPSSLEIRRDLITTIGMLDALDDEDKRLFKELAQGYSGLADLAVPAWILCAGLVKVGGTLAIVVPTTWLSRDYAHPIRYLLRRWFDLSCVVEDGDASWFPDALVRTSLVVATRIARRDSAFAPDARDGYVHVHIDASAADRRSLVGRLFPTADDPEGALATTLTKWRLAGEVPAKGARIAKWIPAAYDAESLRNAAAHERWLERVERLEPTGHGASVPSALVPLIGRVAVPFVTLRELGWHAGQGLRTGANKFFYLRHVETGDGHERLWPASELGERAVDAPEDASMPVLQRQADMPDGYLLRADELDGRVLVLDRYALPEDLATLSDAAYTAMPQSLAEHVRQAGRVNLGSEDDPKYIPNLSAVITNVRAAIPDRPDRRARFWYQLPPFTDRHRPSALVARINNDHPRTLVNQDRRAIVDANFSALWPARQGSVDVYALLALLNSTWCAALFELSGTVMGGGALKIEAAHIRRLPVPELSPERWEGLSALGRQLADDASPGADASPESRLCAIDTLIFEAMGVEDPHQTRERVAALAAHRLHARSA
jgi:hypothetical protein